MKHDIITRAAGIEVFRPLTNRHDFGSSRWRYLLFAAAAIAGLAGTGCHNQQLYKGGHGAGHHVDCAEGGCRHGGGCGHCGGLLGGAGLAGGGGLVGGVGNGALQAGMYENRGWRHQSPETGPAGPPTGTYAYPYYTIRGPRDFLASDPPSIGN